MKSNIFDPIQQQKQISSKIVAGLERISEVFKVLLWEKAKLVGLSPIQIQLMVFIAFHKRELCNVSHLAKEFNITKPTISDAIKVLDKKGMISKDFSSSDNRSYSITLTDVGKTCVEEVGGFADPLKEHIEDFAQTELDNLFSTISKLIFNLNRSGILTVQRTCYGCTYYKNIDAADYCNLLQKQLFTAEIRLDCPEYEERPSG